MRSTARFLEGTLLGVALGVGLGFFVFRKSSWKASTDLWSPAPQLGPQADRTPAQAKDEVVETAPSVAEVMPEVLEELSEAPVQQEEASEEMPPLPTEMEAYTAVDVEPLDVESIPVWAEIPSPQVEVEPDAEAAVDELQTDELVVPETVFEEREEEEVVALGQEAAEEVAEEVTEEVTEQAAEQVEIEAASVPAAADDLKARIEETRRRIRRELEQPFIIGGGVAAAEASLSSEVEPAIGEALAVEPSSEEQLSSKPEESPASPVSAVGESDIARRAEEESQATAQGEAVDYDAMRNRIEETRSRLKAKAFDAMMTGESALLGRDPEGAEVNLPAASEVDGEIVQTIDETLREEES